MRTLYFIGICTFLVLSIVSCNHQVSESANEVLIIKSYSDSLLKAESELNADKAISYFAEDAIVQGAGAPQINGKKAIREMYQQFFGMPQLKEFSVKSNFIDISKSGDIAYEYGVNKVVTSQGKNDLIDVGKYTLVWRKHDDKWLVEILTFSNDNPVPEIVEAR
jgi:uncharacterized protein (TIGR02246 family)